MDVPQGEGGSYGQQETWGTEGRGPHPPAVDLWAGQGPSIVASPKMTRSLSHTQDFHSFNFGFSDDR